MQVTVEGPAKIFSFPFLLNAGKEQEEAIARPYGFSFNAAAIRVLDASMLIERCGYHF